MLSDEEDQSEASGSWMLENAKSETNSDEDEIDSDDASSVDVTAEPTPTPPPAQQAPPTAADIARCLEIAADADKQKDTPVKPKQRSVIINRESYALGKGGSGRAWPEAPFPETSKLCGLMYSAANRSFYTTSLDAEKKIIDFKPMPKNAVRDLIRSELNISGTKRAELQRAASQWMSSKKIKEEIYNALFQSQSGQKRANEAGAVPQAKKPNTDQEAGGPANAVAPVQAKPAAQRKLNFDTPIAPRRNRDKALENKVATLLDTPEKSSQAEATEPEDVVRRAIQSAKLVIELNPAFLDNFVNRTALIEFAKATTQDVELEAAKKLNLSN